MKKIFTLLAAVFVMFSANAETETWKSDTKTPPNNTVELTSISAKFNGEWEFHREAYVSGKTNGQIIEFTTKQKGILVITYGGDISTSKKIIMEVDGVGIPCTLEDGTKIESCSAPTAKIPSNSTITYDLEQGKTYSFSTTGTKYRIAGFSYTVTANLAPISWSEKSQTIQLGSEYTLPTFSNTDPEIAVSFTSSNPEVATVSESGVISLVENALGTTTITATYEGEKYDKTEVSCEITVVSTVDPEFAFSAAEATVIFGGDMSALPVLNMSEGITADEVKYSFSKNNYVAEYKNGSINAIAPGKVVVTASFAGNDKYNAATASYILTVNRESYTVVESEGVVYAYDASVMVIGKDANDKDIYATEATYADGLKVALPTGKQLQPLPGTMTVNGQAYTPFKLSNGAEFKIDAPEGKIIESITVYSVVNYNRPGNNYASRAPYWATLNGVSVEKTADNVMVNFVDMENWGETPDVVSFEVNAASTTIKNTGEQPAVVLVIKYVEEAPAEIAAPTHNQEGETVKVNGSQEVVFTPAADHHVVYTCFEAATAPEVETQAAAETVEHEGKTFTLAADNKVTVDKSGTLHYFAMDPETGVKSPVNTIAFDVTTGIADIDVDSENAPVEYFNMQGIRVANPQNGLYIRRQGNKVEKVYVK